jgi:hypothetical protein
MLAFERTHLLKDDLDWLPRWMKAVRWVVAGTVWTGTALSAVAIAAAAQEQAIFLSQMLAGLALGGAYSGDRLARTVLRRRLTKLAHGDVDIKRLKNEKDGELVHVKGRVHVREPLSGKLGGQGAFRRLRLTVGNTRVVNEAAVDFHLIDESGEMIMVQAAGARLVAEEEDVKPLAGDVLALLQGLTLPPQAARAVGEWEFRFKTGKPLGPLSGAETVVADGQMVEIVGYKSRVVDPTIVERLERDTPLRATLRGGRELPLLIAPSE